MIRGNRLHIIGLIGLCLLLGSLLAHPPDANCGLKDKFQQKKREIDRSFQQKKNDFNKNYQQKKKDVSRSFNQKKEDFSRSYQQKKEDVSRNYQKKKEDLSRTYQDQKRSVTNRVQQEITLLEKRIQNSKRLGNEAKLAAKESISRFGTSAGQTVTSFLEKTKGKGVEVLEKATPIMQRINEKVRDPEVQKRAMAGVLVAAGTGMAIYQHKDDIKYRLYSEGMKRVRIPVNGQMKSVEDIYSEAILKEAPYLRGTAIAQDPAQILAYGVTATAKKDLLNNIDIVPNGRGGLTSVNSAVIDATGAEQGLAVLQIGDTMEGMAVETARNGQLGHNAQIFAAAYAGASEKIEGGH